jgi:hypothetical protein
MKNPEKPAAQHIEWGAVRALAAVVGVREAARRMGISEEQVKKRCTREGWLRSPEARAANKINVASRCGVSPPVPLSPMSPGALIHAEIAQLGSKTRLSLARGMARAGEHVESLTGEDILERANDVKAVAQTADLVHGWKDSAPNVKIRLDVLGSGAAEQPIFEMEADVSASESWDNAVDEY